MKTPLDLFIRADGDWRDDAACLDKDPEMFFPPDGRNDLIQAAKGVCDGCPVKNICLEVRLSQTDYADTDGIFAGTKPKERRMMRRRGAA